MCSLRFILLNANYVSVDLRPCYIVMQNYLIVFCFCFLTPNLEPVWHSFASVTCLTGAVRFSKVNTGLCFQGVTVWTARVTRLWARPRRIQQSLGSAMPARMESLPAVSCAPTRMESSKRRMLGGGIQWHNDLVVSCHLEDTASGTCSETNNS